MSEQDEHFGQIDNPNPFHPISSEELTFTEQTKQRILQELSLMLGNTELATEYAQKNNSSATIEAITEVRDAATRALTIAELIQKASETQTE